MGRFADLCEFLLPDEGEEASSESESKSGSGSKSDSVAATASPSSHKERGVGSKRAARMWWGACALVIGFAVLVRLCTGLHPYSGMHTRLASATTRRSGNWMEITVNLPPSQWYRNSSVNDLSWWGLDYPPLTAWQSRAHGWVVRWFCPDAVALGTSQGYESAYSKALLRWTVLSPRTSSSSSPPPSPSPARPSSAASPRPPLGPRPTACGAGHAAAAAGTHSHRPRPLPVQQHQPGPVASSSHCHHLTALPHWECAVLLRHQPQAYGALLRPGLLRTSAGSLPPGTPPCAHVPLARRHRAALLCTPLGALP
ncbi:hypothetical protein CLOM_g6938 [Closterium sp. NIES-68]|nr:hypothetical protein CLOM_g6938 [Closterium sp. NIES-68]